MKVLMRSTPPHLARFLEERLPSECHLQMITAENLPKEIKDADVLIPGHITIASDMLDMAERMKLIQCGVGYDNVDLEAASLKRIYVANASGTNAVSVAEHVFALILVLSKRLLWVDASMKAGRWEKPGILLDELAGKTLGIVGLGSVGVEVAKRGLAFGMRILSFRRRPVVPEGLDVTLVDFTTLLRDSDFISVNVPLTRETRGMLGEREFELMKETAFLVNTSRGGIVDEKALYSSLAEKRIAGAALDVFEEEPLPERNMLRGLDNVVLTPHIAGRTIEAIHRRYVFFSENIKRVRDGRVPLNLVNRF